MKKQDSNDETETATPRMTDARLDDIEARSHDHPHEVHDGVDAERRGPRLCEGSGRQRSSAHAQRWVAAVRNLRLSGEPIGCPSKRAMPAMLGCRVIPPSRGPTPTSKTEARALARRWLCGNRGDADEARLFAWVRATVESDGPATVWRRLGVKKSKAIVLIELAEQVTP